MSEKTTGCILILEDEEMVSEIAIQMLEHIGYDAVHAADGVEAVELYRQRFLAGTPFTAVIMDLSIPKGVGGAEAVKEVLKIDPQAKVIVSSGYTHDPVMTDYHSHGFSAAIAKPFSLADLSKVLNTLC